MRLTNDRVQMLSAGSIILPPQPLVPLKPGSRTLASIREDFFLPVTYKFTFKLTSSRTARKPNRSGRRRVGPGRDKTSLINI